jgi:glyoxylase-like metal-dependent hydrolase (beta-lactamase superfamily II)
VAVLCAKGGASRYVAEVLREAGLPARNVEGGMLAYGAHLAAERLPLETMAPGLAGEVEVWQLDRRGKGCLSYVVAAGGEAIVVDPARHLEPYLELARRLGVRVVRVLDTHVHADHLSGGRSLAAALGVPYEVNDEGERGAGWPDVVHLGGGVEVTRLHTPGHTPGSTGWVIGGAAEVAPPGAASRSAASGGRILLSGDTLFVGGVGRPDLGGQLERWGRQLYRSLHGPIAALPDETVVLPAHYAGAAEVDSRGHVFARLGDLRQNAPELLLPDEDAFVGALRAGLDAAPLTPAVYAEIVRANRNGRPVPDEQAAEWELGKNQCAASGR